MSMNCEHVIAILLDNTNGEKFFEFLEGGLFPNIKKHVYDRGSFCRHAICQFPSSSANGHTTTATGTFQSKHGVLYANYWDTTGSTPVPHETNKLNLKILRRWDHIIKCKTMFEYLPPEESISYHVIRRGAGTKYMQFSKFMQYGSRYLRRQRSGAISKDHQQGIFEDYLRFALVKSFKKLKGGNQFPKLSLIVSLPSDGMAHEFGHDSDEYKKSLTAVDEMIGMFVNGLDEDGIHYPGLNDLGIYDQTAFMLFADHSSKPYIPANKIELIGDLKKAFNWRCYSAPRLTKRKVIIPAWDALLCEGSEFIQVHLPDVNNHTIHEIPFNHLEAHRVDGYTINFKSYFFKQEGVARIYHKIDSNTLVVHSRDGVSQISRDGKRAPDRSYKYQVIAGLDPLFYTQEAPSVADGNYHSHLDWLNETYRASLPNVPDNMFGFFDCYLAPTFIVTAADGWVFWNPNNPEDHALQFQNEHDGEYRYEVTTPVLIGGAGVKQGEEIPACQNIDILPTILKMLKVPFDPSDFHGRPLVEILIP